jgi:hypothetical protein
MSRNIDQVFTDNPASSMLATDLYYLGRSPYGLTNDMGILWSNVMTSITVVGTITAGTWNGSIIEPAYGGTGVNNGSLTVTLGGNLLTANSFTTVGNYSVIQTYTGSTNVTFPTSGTLATTSQIPSFTWVDVTSSTQTLISGQGFVADNGAVLVTFTLPVLAAFGTTIEIQGKSVGLWTVSQGVGQEIRYGDEVTTTGVTGSLASTNQWDYARLLCVTANTVWTVTGSIGNLTVT